MTCGFDKETGVKYGFAEIGRGTHLSKIQIALRRGVSNALGREWGVYYEPWGGAPFLPIIFWRTEKTNGISQIKISVFIFMRARGYGYRHVGFILDRGYFSKENIQYMDKCGYDFVTMVKDMNFFVSDLILENKGKFENSRECNIKRYKTYGMTDRPGRNRIMPRPRKNNISIDEEFSQPEIYDQV